MVVFMVATMEFYNQGLMDGRLSWAAMGRAIHEMVFMMPLCFIMSFFIADPITARITARNTDEDSDAIVRTTFRATVTVSMMCPIMSFIATLLFQNAGNQVIALWLQAMFVNFPMTLG